MTTEIAVLNKFGLALAADSAVTVEQFDDKTGKIITKTHNSANKLFTLSKYAPVGIMFYNTVTLGGIPWETIVKDYRSKLNDKTFETLEQYASDFFEYIESDEHLLADHRTDWIFRVNIYRELVALSNNSKNSKDFRKKLADQIQELEKIEAIPFFNAEFSDVFRARYQATIAETIELALSPSLIRGNKRNLNKFVHLKMSRKKLLSGYSGIVIAGFGEHEYLPRLQHFVCDCVVNNRVRKWKLEEKQITATNPGEVIPFADNEVIKTLINGINPSFQDRVETEAFKFMIKIPELYTDLQDDLTAEKKKKLRGALINPMIDVIKTFWNNIETLRHEEYEMPVIRTISNLPAAELGNVAETLINAAHIHKKVNPSFETVGGPVDVAVISKGDGFVWVKRKHYFDQDANPTFALKYFK